MNKRMRTTIAMLGLLLTCAVHAEPMVKLSPDRQQVKPGEVFTVAVVIENFPLTEGGGISLSYPPAVLRLMEVAVNQNIWSFVTRNGISDPATGTVKDIVFSSYAGVTGNAPVATLRFEALARGAGKVVLSTSTLNPFAANGTPLAVKFKPGVILVK